MRTRVRELVPLGQVTAALGGSTEALDHWMRKFRVKATPDWDGQPMIPAEDAAKIVDAYRRAQSDHEQALAEYQRYLKDRERRLVEAADKAYRETAEREFAAQYERPWAKGSDGMGYASVTYTNALTLWPRGRALAREAALEARAEFEKREPRLRFEEWNKRRRKR